MTENEIKKMIKRKFYFVIIFIFNHLKRGAEK